MKLRQLGPNQTELHLAGGVVVFFSYETPVAALIPAIGLIRTSTKYSRTTTKHINNWVGQYETKIVEQAELDDLVNA